MLDVGPCQSHFYSSRGWWGRCCCPGLGPKGYHTWLFTVRGGGDRMVAPRDQRKEARLFWNIHSSPWKIISRLDLWVVVRWQRPLELCKQHWPWKWVSGCWGNKGSIFQIPREAGSRCLSVMRPSGHMVVQSSQWITLGFVIFILFLFLFFLFSPPSSSLQGQFISLLNKWNMVLIKTACWLNNLCNFKNILNAAEEHDDVRNGLGPHYNSTGINKEQKHGVIKTKLS